MDIEEMDFEIEFEEDPVPEGPVQPVQPEPAQPSDVMPDLYAYTDYVSKEEKKKERSKGKIFALLVAVAVVAGVLGAVLNSAIGYLRPDDKDEETMQAAEEQEEEQEEDAPEEKPYGLEEHALPETLSTNDTGKSLTPAQVYELTVNSVVGIRTESTVNAFGQEAVAASAGSGFILSEDGYIITNCHVISGADKITVDLFNGDSFSAQLVGADSSFDIAVLKIEASGLPAVSVGDSDKLKVGEEVAAIGNPLGELTFTMTNGILSALDREINTDGNPQNMIQTNAAINSGNSGGPLFDMDGNVIGVTTAKYSGSTTSGTTIEGLGFAIPINEALKVAYDLVDYGYVKGQAYLGITVASLDTVTAQYYGLPVGPRVESITPDSCADKAGLQVGDVIVALDDEPVENTAELLAALKRHKAGDTITLTIFRAGAETQITVTLDEKPSQDVIDAATAARPDEEEEIPDGYQYHYPDGFFN